MKLLKKLTILLLLFVFVFSVGIYVYLSSTQPKYKGELTLNGISNQTEVYFDTYGVPHIYAKNSKDAMTALGYVHAQERLWQMELLRRIAPGKLSELFGSSTLETDMFFAALGIEENSEKAVAALDKNSEAFTLANAYLQGINQYLENGKTPIEFTLLGLQKQPFTLKDVYNVFGFMSFSFAMAQKTDPLLTDIRDTLGPEYLIDFGIDGSFNTKRLKSSPSEYSVISRKITALLNQSPATPFIGSNSWVIGSKKTQSGKVIFANDPHIGFAQPGTWYEAHVSYPGYEMYGYYLAGVPFPLLGHNYNYAYGLTMFENDDLDMYILEENANNTQYLYKQELKSYGVREKIIKVKDSASVKLKVKQSLHGPVLTGLMNSLKTKKPVAVNWVYTQGENQILEAVYRLSHAKNLNDFHQSVSLIHAPGLNVMYGDAENNIAWITSGKLYTMKSNPGFILNGSNGYDDQKEFLPFENNPKAINPNWGYVYSSNNQPEAIKGYLYPGYYLPKDRAIRIDGLLSSKNNWNLGDTKKMIVDVTSSTSSTMLQTILPEIQISNLTQNQRNALAILRSWRGTNTLQESAPTIFNKFLYHYLKNTFQDELGQDNFKAFLETHLVKQIMEPQLANKQSVWWDNKNTNHIKETRSFILTKSFQDAIATLEQQLGSDIQEWKWSRVHHLEHQHPMGKVSWLRPFFNVGSFPVPGSNEVINNLMFIYTDEAIIPVKAGPSTRRIIDFSNVDNSVSILPTGQSGHPVSEHYDNQAEMYNKGEFRSMLLDKKKIVKVSTKLVFQPR